MTLEPEPPVIVSPEARRRAWLVKTVLIGGLLLLLQVPLVMVRGVLQERRQYQAQAMKEISSVWGREQRILGPVLSVPYSYQGNATRTKLVNGQWMQVEERTWLTATAFFLPETLRIEANVDPEVRHRGIYDVVVYATTLKLSGSVRADFAAAGIDADRIDWGKARLLFGVTDLHGLRSITPLRRADGAEVAFEASDSSGAGSLPIGAAAGISATNTGLEFAVTAVVQGSGTVSVAPLGNSTTMTMRSNWASPSFTGAWLPLRRQITPAGFEAEWSIAPFSRGFPQSWTNRFTAEDAIVKLIDPTAFGVRLSQGIDGYSVVQRAQKYGMLFFVLVFAVFFLFEVTAGLRIHPLQYGMVGAALCLFFLGFLALTEFWSTAAAYGTVASACTAMVSLYSWAFLRSGLRTLIVLGGLAATYGYLYFVLKSEDYALIAGTAALFAVLALVMFFTRRINWYALDATTAKAQPSISLPGR